MNKTKNTFITLLFCLLGCTGTSGFVVQENTDQQDKEEPYVGGITHSIPIPEKTDFCGEEIDLDRYDLYERFDREITAFTYMHSNTLGSIKRANRYFPLLEAELKKNDIPKDFIYLSFIESDMRPRAVSHARAAGFWQLLPQTARQYGLEVNQFVDERFDPVKATYAASRYLKEAYAKFGSWIDVAASYNAGMARISTTRESQQVNSILDMWLNEETYRYVMRIVAAKELLKKPSLYGFLITADQLYQPIEVKEMKITTSIDDLVAFAKNNGTTYLHLKDLNPWLISTSLPNKSGKEYTILIPVQDKMGYKSMPDKAHDENWIVK